jgi:hypothetical protein
LKKFQRDLEPPKTVVDSQLSRLQGVERRLGRFEPLLAVGESVLRFRAAAHNGTSIEGLLDGLEEQIVEMTVRSEDDQMIFNAAKSLRQMNRLIEEAVELPPERRNALAIRDLLRSVENALELVGGHQLSGFAAGAVKQLRAMKPAILQFLEGC